MGSQEGWLCWQGCCERSINAAASIHPWIYVSPLSLFLCLFFPPSSFLFSSLSTSFFPHAHLLSRNFVVSFCLELVSIFHVPSPIVSSLSFPSPLFFIRVVPKRFAVLCLCFKIEVHSTFSSWSILRVPAYTLPVSSSFSFFFSLSLCRAKKSLGFHSRFFPSILPRTSWFLFSQDGSRAFGYTFPLCVPCQGNSRLHSAQ